MIDTLYFEFGEVRIFSNFVVAVMNEGVSIKSEYFKDLKNISEKYYKDKLFGYISFRRNSYAVDPLIYLKTSKIETLVAFAVVSSDGIKCTNVELEKRFYTKPFKHFNNLDDAKLWVYEIIAQNENKVIL